MRDISRKREPHPPCPQHRRPFTHTPADLANGLLKKGSRLFACGAYASLTTWNPASPGKAHGLLRAEGGSMSRRRGVSSTQYCPPSSQLGRWRLGSHVVFMLFLALVLFTVHLVSKQGLSEGSPLHNSPLYDLIPLNFSRIYPPHRTKCRFHLCFNISRCVFTTEDIIGVNIATWREFRAPQNPSSVLTPLVSWEYEELVEAIRRSRYYTSDPSKACVFVPFVDTLRQGAVDNNTMSMILNSLPG